MRKIKAFLLGVCVSILAYAGVAYAQSYPTQPTFLKWGLGIGPNTAEVQANWGGVTPLGFGVVAQQTNADGGTIMFLAREAGIDPDTDTFFIGVGANGSNGAMAFTAPYGNALEFFSDAGGATGVTALGAGTSDVLEMRSARQYIINNAPLFDLVESDAAANEDVTRTRATAGLYEIVSLTDALGAGNPLIAADRSGTSWQNLVISTQAGSGITISPAGGINYTFSTTALSTGSFLRAGSGAAANPGLSFNGDTNTGFYSSGVDQMSMSLGGSQRIFWKGDQTELNNGTAASPSYSFVNDPDSGLYRVGVNSLGIAVNGANEVTIATAGSVFQNAVTVGAGGIAVTGNSSITGALTVTSCTGCTPAGVGNTYGGFVDAAATGESVPTGWSVALAGSDYTITHNLGNADHAITATHANTNTPPRCNASATARNANTTVIRWYSATDMGDCTSNDWTFVLTVIGN